MDGAEVTPYDLVVQGERPCPASKDEVLRLTRALEREALAVPGPTGASLQDVRYVTERTRAAYARLAEAGAAPVLYARDLPAYVAPGVSGVALDDDDPLVDVWSLVVLSERPVVMAAVDLHAASLRGAVAYRAGLPGVDLRGVDLRDGAPGERRAGRLEPERDFLVAVSRDRTSPRPASPRSTPGARRARPASSEAQAALSPGGSSPAASRRAGAPRGGPARPARA